MVLSSTQTDFIDKFDESYNVPKLNFCFEQESNLYKELAEKEESLMLAAQFGKTLLEEKEQLELQLESLKTEYQNKIEVNFIKLKQLS